MLFIFLFTCCAMAIPISLDIHKNGKNNILTKAGKDVTNSKLGKQVRIYFNKIKS